MPNVFPKDQGRSLLILIVTKIIQEVLNKKDFVQVSVIGTWVLHLVTHSGRHRFGPNSNPDVGTWRGRDHKAVIARPRSVVFHRNLPFPLPGHSRKRQYVP